MVLMREKREMSRSKPKFCCVAIYSRPALDNLLTYFLHPSSDLPWGNKEQRPVDEGVLEIRAC